MSADLVKLAVDLPAEEARTLAGYLFAAAEQGHPGPVLLSGLVRMRQALELALIDFEASGVDDGR